MADMHTSTQDNVTRYLSLDALRGFAVMGILAMNIIAFAMPEWAYITPLAYGGDGIADQISWLFSFIFIDGKMRGLFSLLFGASMLLVIERAETAGRSGMRTHYVRMFWLLIFGLIHFYFIWFGDILVTYALIALLAVQFRQWEPERLIKWALIVYALGFVMWALQFGGLQFLQWAATQPGADADLARQFREVVNSPELQFNVTQELTVHRGGYTEIVADKLADWTQPFTAALQALTETLPLMMLGMALFKNGFLTGSWAAADYRRWALRLAVTGLVLNALVGLWVVMSGYDKITALAGYLAWSLFPRLLVTLGYAAGLLLLIGKYASSPLIARVAAAGKAAFTNYLGTSIVMTTIFYGYGLGLYGSVNRVWLWPFVLGACVVMLLWSKPWLDRFRYGPLEWLWRSLARGALQPMRR